ncbi:hypothetical protein KCP78_00350 [Salmonella enterica subsp. enterica]|nr:hypothetical protein KCP78_00350 [Salmonella enterica subsp. enterica]
MRWRLSFRKRAITLADREAARDEENAIMALVQPDGHFTSGACSGLSRSSPKTRSGKMRFAARSVRSAKAAIPGDSTTITDDPANAAANSPAIEEIAVKPDSRVRQRVSVCDRIVGV